MRKALVLFSGGQDSTVCLLQAINEYGRESIETITFSYGQRHGIELQKAAKIVTDFDVAQSVIQTTVLQQITDNSLINKTMKIESNDHCYPNTFVDGRNALFLLLAACHAKKKSITNLIIGVSQADYSGYPDCRDDFIKSMNTTLNLALDYTFTISTPLMYLTKQQIWQLADELGYLDYVIEETHTCYHGIENGCHRCPSCLLREKGLRYYLARKNSESTS